MKIFPVLFLVLLLVLSPKARAAISNESAIKAIAGEAEGEGARGMLAVACAIRNRGHLRGVYGVKAPRVIRGRIRPHTWREAARAWRESRLRDITGGADHWHNVKREGKRKWTREFKRTAVIGRHEFFKSGKTTRK